MLSSGLFFNKVSTGISTVLKTSKKKFKPLNLAVKLNLPAVFFSFLFFPLFWKNEPTFQRCICFRSQKRVRLARPRGRSSPGRQPACDDRRSARPPRVQCSSPPVGCADASGAPSNLKGSVLGCIIVITTSFVRFRKTKTREKIAGVCTRRNGSYLENRYRIVATNGFSSFNQVLSTYFRVTIHDTRLAYFYARRFFSRGDATQNVDCIIAKVGLHGVINGPIFWRSFVNDTWDFMLRKISLHVSFHVT